MVKMVLTFILTNSKYLRRKTTFSAQHSLPVKTIGCLCDISGGTQALGNLRISLITLAAQASGVISKRFYPMKLAWMSANFTTVM